jgi:Na+-driven multidrug efflux pump
MSTKASDKFTREASSVMDDVQDFTTCEGLKKIMRQSVWPIIGSLFHPTYLLVNAIVLGRITCNPGEECIKAETYLAAFGLGSSLMSIVLLASGICFVLGLNNILP